MFKKNKKQTETIKEPKEKKVRTVKVGTHKKAVIALWVVLIASVSFGVYKNFTAIDQHTTHEKEIIELRLQDTNGIENFVKNFAKSYYTWNNSKEAIESRTQAINGYLTKELQDLNVDTIRTDIPTSSTVTDVIVWSIEQSGTDTFSATYEVDQQIKEGEKTSNVKATYTVKVHIDADGDMVIVQNPTLAPAIEKSDYEPKTPDADGYYNDVTDKIVAFPTTYAWKMANYGKVHAAGVDAILAATVPLTEKIRLIMSGGYTWQKAIDLTDSDAKNYKDQLPYTPLHSGNASAIVETPWVNVGYSAVGVGKRYYLSQNIPENEIEGYLEHTMSLSHEFALGGCRLLLQAEIINLTDEQYDVIKYYPMPGRSWRLTGTFKF